MDFKVTYLDAGLTSSYFSDGETPPSNGSSSTPANANAGSAKVPKRYKAHLRDFLSSCRGKRAKHTHHSPTGNRNSQIACVMKSHLTNRICIEIAFYKSHVIKSDNTNCMCNEISPKIVYVIKSHF